MTKLNDIEDQNVHRSKVKYANDIWIGWSNARLQTLARINNYLFVLNTGALLAAMTYLAGKPASQGIS